MKYLTTGLILLSVLFISCSDSILSQLSGKWQMQSMTEGSVVTPNDTIFYNFENELFQYQIYSPSSGIYRNECGYNDCDGKTIRLEFENNPVPIDSFIIYTDWTSRVRFFTVDEVSSSRLVLSSEGKTYQFRKF